jgi:YggT family protein
LRATPAARRSADAAFSSFGPSMLWLLYQALELYKWVIIAVAIMSWLIAFDVINTRNDIVRAIWNALLNLTEPVLRPIRRFMPNLGGLDISPIVLIFIVILLQQALIGGVRGLLVGF